MATEISSDISTRRSHWRRLLAQQQRSGMSQAAFCRQRHISSGTFSWWKLNLKRQGKVRRSLAAPRFVPVRVIKRRPLLGTPGGAENGGTFDVELRSGHRIRLSSSFDADALRKLVAILGEAPTC